MPTKQLIKVDGKELSVSNLDKVFFPESGFTKGQVIGFYASIADTILPHLHGRPLTMKRYPDGISGQPFYEKNAPSHRPEWVETFPVPRSEGGDPINYVLCNDKPTLLWTANLGDIEKHTLLAQVSDLNCPKALVFDLDPGEPADILDCCRVALSLKGFFDGWGLRSFVKVSGSKGLHLSVPLNTPATYELTQPFAKAVAQLAVQQAPQEVVFDMTKALRRGKVLIDWSQNSDFKTTVCVYSMRAKEGGPFVSMPVTWEEIGKALKTKKAVGLIFTPEQAVKRIGKLGDLFQPVLEVQQELPPGFRAALAASPPQKLTTWQRHSGKVRDKSLREYASKRDHSQTREPAAQKVKAPKANKPLRFVIQKHAASRLHYDWRLEMDGVLRSWAVPKGPPTKPREARLAVHVEDHPLEYASFEGTIPAGNYGGGTVMLWDHGEYEDLTGDPPGAFKAGKMHLVLHGEKLQGEWILLKDKRDDEGNRWLLIKAGAEMKPLSIRRDDTSVVSGRSMKAIARDGHKPLRKTPPAKVTAGITKSSGPAKKRVPPRYLGAMQCKPVAELPDEEGWSFELKFDGFRCLAAKTGAEVNLFSRTHKSLNARFPTLVTALGKLGGEFAMDGEVVALDEQGKPSFQLLQNSRTNELPVFFYAFDLLNLGGVELIQEPFQTRRSKLETFSQGFSDPIRISPLLHGTPEQILGAVEQMGLEGVVAKQEASLYEAATRSGAWVKRHTHQEQEFVIGGFVPGSKGFDRLLLGVYEGKQLNYVAKLPNGFVDQTRRAIFPKLDALRTLKCPFANLPEPRGSSRWGEPLTAEKMKECAWVKPRLVCQVAFTEWTAGGKLRHPTFVAMRDDKKANQVVRET
ncbi:MAG: non-homologous end-joining DNA ligase [Verrucomicrobiota bacterium]